MSALRQIRAHRLSSQLRSARLAQNNFIRTIRMGHTGWATAAGYRIGSLYEKPYDDLPQVPVPPSLEDEGKKFYLDVLRRKVGVPVMKAIQVYERSLEMARRVGEENEWVKCTSASLERMKALAMAQIDEPWYSAPQDGEQRSLLAS